MISSPEVKHDLRGKNIFFTLPKMSQKELQFD